MQSSTSDKEAFRTTYAVRRTRLLAKRKAEEARLAQAREAIRRIDRDLMALDRERMQLDRQNANAARAAKGIARAAKQFASTATR